MTMKNEPPPIVAEGMRIFTHRQAVDWAPYLCVLGPRGSGKSDYLAVLRGALEETEEKSGERLHVAIDLKKISPAPEARMYDHLVNDCRNAVPEFRRTLLRVGGENGGASFDRLLRGLLGAWPAGMILYLDSLDSVPGFFARSLSRRFRSYMEERESQTCYQRLGLVFAGALSVFNLRREHDSAPAVSERIVLPFLDLERRRMLVSQGLARYGVTEVSPPVTDLLADETGGEPAFLFPVVERLTPKPDGLLDDPDAVRQVIEDAASLASPAPIFRELLLTYHGHASLRKLIGRMSGGNGSIRPESQVVDVDPFQLMGAVVLDSRTRTPCYRFRNGMVERFFKQLVNGARTGLPRGRDGEPVGFFKELKRLDQLRGRAQTTRTLWECLAVMAEAWQLLTPYPSPQFQLVLDGRKGVAWRFDSASRMLEEVSTAQPDRMTVFSARIASEGKLCLSIEDHGFCAGVYLPVHGVHLILVARFEGNPEEEFCETRFLHWQPWVAELKQPLETRALAEVGWKALADPHWKRDPVTSAAARLLAETQVPENGLGKALEQVRTRIRYDIERQVTACKWCIVSVALLALVGGVWLLSDKVGGATWSWLEPKVFLVTTTLALLSGILALFGLKMNWIGLRVRYEARCCELLLARRLARNHLMELLAMAGPGSPSAAPGEAQEPRQAAPGGERTGGGRSGRASSVGPESLSGEAEPDLSPRTPPAPG